MSKRAAIYASERIALAVTVLIGFAPLSSCRENTPSPARPALPGTVEGLATEVNRGNPVPGVGLALVNPSDISPATALTYTDSTGHYRWADVPAGRYMLFLVHPYLFIHDQTSAYVVVESGRATTHNLRLQAGWWYRHSWQKIWWILGVVTDSATGRPIAGAYVADSFHALHDDLWDHFFGVSAPGFAITDSLGRFSIAPLVASINGRAGFSPLCVTRSGYRPCTLVGTGATDQLSGDLLPLPTGRDSALSVQVRLTPEPSTPSRGTGAIGGRVICEGSPVAGVPVGLSLIGVAQPDTLFPASRKPVPVPKRTVVTGPDGRFLIAGLVPGTYSVIAGYLPDDGYIPHPWRAGFVGNGMTRVAAGQTADLPALRVLPVIAPLAPADGSITADARPEFPWTAFAGGGPVSYCVWCSWDWPYNHQEDGPFRIDSTSWTFPDTLRALVPGTHFRWIVDVVERGSDNGIGGFDRPATFSVAGDAVEPSAR